MPLPGSYNPNLPTLVSNTGCPSRHLCTSKPGQGKDEKLADGGVGEDARATPGEELKTKSGEKMRLKLGAERMYDLGRGEDRPKLQTPRVATRYDGVSAMSMTATMQSIHEWLLESKFSGLSTLRRQEI